MRLKCCSLFKIETLCDVVYEMEMNFKGEELGKYWKHVLAMWCFVDVYFITFASAMSLHTLHKVTFENEADEH